MVMYNIAEGNCSKDDMAPEALAKFPPQQQPNDSKLHQSANGGVARGQPNTILKDIYDSLVTIDEAINPSPQTDVVALNPVLLRHDRAKKISADAEHHTNANSKRLQKKRTRKHKQPKFCTREDRTDRVLTTRKGKRTQKLSGYSEHSGTMTAVNTTLTQYLTDFLPDEISSTDPTIVKFADLVESLLLLFGSLRGTEEPSSMLCSIGQFLKHYVDNPVSLTILDYINDICSVTTTQALSDDDELGFAGFIESLKGCRDNWHLIMTGPFAKMISKLLGVLVAVGIYQTSDLTFTIKGFKVLEPEVEITTANAPDLITGIMDLGIFFLERSYKAWNQKDASIFFLDDSQSADIDEEFIWVNSNWSLIETGEQGTGLNKKEYDLRLNKLALQMRDVLRCTPRNTILHSVLEKKLLKLQTLITQSEQLDLSSSHRHLPFTIGLFGDSGFGKTTIGMQLIEAVAAAADAPRGKDHTYIRKPGTSFWDRYKNSVNIIVFDDINNKKNAADDTASNEIVDFVNRVPYSPPMADVTEKGKMNCTADYGLFTGHDKTLNAAKDSICPKSIQRRCQYQLDVKVKPEFAFYVDGICAGIDTAKVVAHYTDPSTGATVPRLVDDVLTYTVTVVGVAADSRFCADYKVVEYYGKELRDVDCNTVLAFLIDMDVRHRHNEKLNDERQKMNAEAPAIARCAHEGCKHFTTTCPYHKQTELTSAPTEASETEFPHLPPQLTTSEKNDEHKPAPQRKKKKKNPKGDIHELLGILENKDLDITILEDEVAKLKQQISDNQSNQVPDSSTHDELPDVDVTLQETSMTNQDLTKKTFSFFMKKMKNNVVSSVARKAILGDAAMKVGIYQCASKLWECSDWLQLVPTWLVANPAFRQMVNLVDTDKIYDVWKRDMIFRGIPFFSTLGLTIISSILSHVRVGFRKCPFVLPYLRFGVKVPVAQEASTNVIRAPSVTPLFQEKSLSPTVTHSDISDCQMTKFFDVIVESTRNIISPRFGLTTTLTNLLGLNQVTYQRKFCTIDYFRPRLTPFLACTTLGLGAYWMLQSRASWSYSKMLVLKDINERNDVTAICSRGARDKFMTHAGAYASAAAVLYIALKACRAAKAAHAAGFEGFIDNLLGISTPQPGTIGSSKPTLPEVLPDVTEQSQNVVGPDEGEANLETSQWLRPIIQQIQLTDKSKNMTGEQVLNVIKKNLVYAIFGDPVTRDAKSVGDILYIHQNMIVFPKHYVKDDKEILLVCKRNDDPSSTNHSYEIRIFPSMIYRTTDTDLVVVHVTTHGALCADIRHLFPLDYIPHKVSQNFNMTYRNKTGAIDHSKGIAVSGSYQIPGGEAMMGMKYTVNNGKCFNGLCGAPISSTGDGACIMGFHVAGTDGPEGISAQLTQNHIEEAVNYFKSKNYHFARPVVPLRKSFLDHPIGGQTAINQKNFLHFQKEYFHGTPVGAGDPPRTKKSNLRKLPIADDVQEVFDDTTEYVKPKMNPSWFGTQQWADKARQPMSNVDPELLDMAAQDYLKAAQTVSRSDKWLGKKRPLTLRENLNGIPGRRFVPPINLATACGPPLTGKKSKIIETIEETGERVLIPELLTEFVKADATIRSGQRLGLPTKMFAKDEPQTKPKVRQIFATNIMLTLLVRKYFLPIIEMIELNPEIFECAVGTNAMSQEWHVMMRRIRKFGKDLGIAGDFSGFDTKLTKQLLVKYLWILIILGQDIGYSATDKIAMEVICDELTEPIVDIDGAFVLFQAGCWISGNSLTTIANGGVNSLLMRMFFFSFKEYRKLSFRDFVAAGVYGDDMIGSASRKVSKFNSKSYADWLKRYGMILTNPNKVDDIPEYYDLDGTDFLKRLSVYHPKLGVNVGALDERSIFRMLRVCIHKKGNGKRMEDLAAENIGTALNEAFLHGEEYYKDFAMKVKGIAEKHNLTPLVKGMDLTYDDKVDIWIKNYGARAIGVIEEEGRSVPETYLGVST